MPKMLVLVVLVVKGTTIVMHDNSGIVRPCAGLQCLRQALPNSQQQESMQLNQCLQYVYLEELDAAFAVHIVLSPVGMGPSLIDMLAR